MYHDDNKIWMLSEWIWLRWALREACPWNLRLQSLHSLFLLCNFQFRVHKCKSKWLILLQDVIGWFLKWWYLQLSMMWETFVKIFDWGKSMWLHNSWNQQKIRYSNKKPLVQKEIRLQQTPSLQNLQGSFSQELQRFQASTMMERRKKSRRLVQGRALKLRLHKLNPQPLTPDKLSSKEPCFKTWILCCIKDNTIQIWCHTIVDPWRSHYGRKVAALQGKHVLTQAVPIQNRARMTLKEGNGNEEAASMNRRSEKNFHHQQEMMTDHVLLGKLGSDEDPRNWDILRKWPEEAWSTRAWRRNLYKDPYEGKNTQ